MHILVINGSPKGENSITLQTVKYLEKAYPAHTFEVLHAGQRIKVLEKDFSDALEMALRADLLLFAYPVYTFIAPSQLHRCIELLKSTGADLSGKFVSQITTSKHFYDVTAHRYIQDNCQDMDMKVIRGLSADMDDLLTHKGQKDARDFSITSSSAWKRMYLSRSWSRIPRRSICPLRRLRRLPKRRRATSSSSPTASRIMSS